MYNKMFEFEDENCDLCGKINDDSRRVGIYIEGEDEYILPLCKKCQEERVEFIETVKELFNDNLYY